MFETRGLILEPTIKHMHLQTCIASEAVSIASVSPMNCSQIYKKKKTKKKSAIQKEAHMHTKSFVVVRFCFVRPPGLELNLTSSAFLGTLSFLLVLINDFVRGCEWVLKVTRPRPPDRTLFEPWALITPSFPWPLWGLINSVRSLYSFSAVKRMR